MKYTYTFDQLRDNEAGMQAMFMNYTWAVHHGGVNQDNYFTADSGTVEAASPLQACEKLYFIYNTDYSAGYTGRSMSVSDIVNIWDNEQDPPKKTTWYCDSVGFLKLKGGAE